jgi:hypothetical protein
MLKTVKAFRTMAERIKASGANEESTKTDDEAIGKAQIA